MINLKESKITCTGIYKAEYQSEDTLTAELRQTVSKTYSRFSKDENPFNIGTKYTQTRVYFMEIPKDEFKSPEEVTEFMEMNYPDARLRQILSSKPILTERHLAAITTGLISEKEIAEKQVVISNDGEVILHNGKPQYRVVTLSLTGLPDEDLRERVQNAVVENAVKTETA